MKRFGENWVRKGWLTYAVFCHESSLNTLRPRQNSLHFADDIFKSIFLKENVWISITISLNLVPKGRINNIPALVQILAWRRRGDKPLSEPMMVSLMTHICVIRPQWVIKCCNESELFWKWILVMAGGKICNYCYLTTQMWVKCNMDGLVQERCNFIANALELHLSCTNSSIQKIKSEASVKSFCEIGPYF